MPASSKRKFSSLGKGKTSKVSQKVGPRSENPTMQQNKKLTLSLSRDSLFKEMNVLDDDLDNPYAYRGDSNVYDSTMTNKRKRRGEEDRRGYSRVPGRDERLDYSDSESEENRGSDQEDEIDYTDSLDEKENGSVEEDEGEYFGRETTEEKRIRLAKQLLKSVYNETDKEEVSEDETDEDEDEDEEDYGTADDDSSDTSSHGGDVKQSHMNKKMKLGNRKNEFVGSTDLESALEEKIGSKLELARLRAKGLLNSVTSSFIMRARVDMNKKKIFKGHDSSITCLALTSDEKYIYTASKDGSLFRHDIMTGNRLVLIPTRKKRQQRLMREEGQQKNESMNSGVIRSFSNNTKKTTMSKSDLNNSILSIAVSSDGRYIACGDSNGKISVFDSTQFPRQVKNNNDGISTLNVFQGHRDIVSALAFRHNSHTLYSGSYDRCLMHWDLDALSYIDTLYGHQAEMNSIDTWIKERALSGSRDGTVRLFKVPENTHLIFANGHTGSNVDCVSLINDELFVSGGDDGAICVWSINRKKPIGRIHQAHGVDEHGIPRWITSLTSVKQQQSSSSKARGVQTFQNEYVLATGSWDGVVRIWSISISDTTQVNLIKEIPVVGIINGIKISNTGDFILVAVGEEHRCGKWVRIKEAKSSAHLIPLRFL